MASNYALAEVLLHHGVITDATPEASVTDEARAAGLIHACLGCGSVAAINPADGEAARVRTRDHIDWDAYDCCPDADSVLF
jgi:hypothetical protein